MSRQATGLRAWVIQRVSAIYLLLFFPYLIGKFILVPPASHADWVSWLSLPVVSIGLLVFVLALLVHAWVGARDILVDYVHPVAARITLLSLLGFGLVACGLWAFKVIIIAHAT